MPSPERARLDQVLLTRQLARSRSHAAQLIEAGHVLVNGAVAAKAAQKVSDADTVSVEPAARTHYVSRAAHKLLSALEIFADFAVEGRTFLDAGASTGGFTQVLLERGATRVIAADVGHDQLAPQVRADPRVQAIDGLNLRYATPDDLGAQVEALVADLSFISLTLLVPAFAGLVKPAGDLLLMVKPQFEVGKAALPDTGVVINGEDRRRAVASVLDAAHRAGLSLQALAASGTPGQDGNQEYFLWLRNCTEVDAQAQRSARDMVEKSEIF